MEDLQQEERFYSQQEVQEQVAAAVQRIQAQQARPMGSMKSTAAPDSGIKEFYTREEALKFTRQELDRSPELFRAIERSMRKW